eukprot:111443-Prorocentrum_minimum.AAC.1
MQRVHALAEHDVLRVQVRNQAAHVRDAVCEGVQRGSRGGSEGADRAARGRKRPPRGGGPEGVQRGFVDQV